MDMVSASETNASRRTGAARLETIALLICLALLFVGCGRVHEEYINGQGQAERDAAKGNINVAYGGDARIEPANGEYAELLRKQYHIGIRSYSLPTNPEAAEAWARGYNEAMLPVIERKFGSNVLQQAMAEARKLHEAAVTNRSAHDPTKPE